MANHADQAGVNPSQWRGAVVAAGLMIFFLAVAFGGSSEDGLRRAAGGYVVAPPPPPPADLGPALEPSGTHGLPAQGIAVEREEGVVLVGLDGRVLGHFPGYRLGSAPPGGYGPDLVLADTGGRLAAFEPADGRMYPAPDAPRAFDGRPLAGCAPIRGGDGLAVCDDGRTIESLQPGGERRVVARAPSGAGHWAYALRSPDGTQLLAQWSGECESPSAWLVPAAGGEPRPVATGAEGPPAESVALGWHGERPVVHLWSGICGAGVAGPGVYLLGGEVTRLYPTGVGDRAQLW